MPVEGVATAQHTAHFVQFFKKQLKFEQCMGTLKEDFKCSHASCPLLQKYTYLHPTAMAVLFLSAAEISVLFYSIVP